ncbi:MAG: hypothetical protein AAB116_20380 [Candidatus Poribacteria bacterium]
MNNKILTICFAICLLTPFVTEASSGTSFVSDSNGSRYALIDIIQATYRIMIEKQGTVSITTEWNFDTAIEGPIVFDYVGDIKTAVLDNNAIEFLQMPMPDGLEMLQVSSISVTPGNHNITIKTSLLLEDNDLFFQFNDRKNRNFLEKYAPANLQFDQYASRFVIATNGINISDYTVIANGKITYKDNQIEVIFPSYYNCASYFFHLFESSKYIVKQVGDLTIYGTDLQHETFLMSETKSIEDIVANEFNEMEKLLGPWPHNYKIIKLLPFGGMEYAGAMNTSRSKLEHEIFHSYIGRSAMPRDGKAAWIDEMLATWLDRARPSFRSVDRVNAGLNQQIDLYARVTIADAYEYGFLVSGYLDFKLRKSNKSLFEFIRWFHQKYKHSLFSYQQFLEALEEYGNKDLRNDFEIIIGAKKKPWWYL